MIRPPPRSPLFPYTTLSRSHAVPAPHGSGGQSTPGGGEEGGGREEVATQPALPRRWARTSLRCSLTRRRVSGVRVASAGAGPASNLTPPPAPAAAPPPLAGGEGTEGAAATAGRGTRLSGV